MTMVMMTTIMKRGRWSQWWEVEKTQLLVDNGDNRNDHTDNDRGDCGNLVEDNHEMMTTGMLSTIKWRTATCDRIIHFVLCACGRRWLTQAIRGPALNVCTLSKHWLLCNSAALKLDASNISHLIIIKAVKKEATFWRFSVEHKTPFQHLKYQLIGLLTLVQVAHAIMRYANNTRCHKLCMHAPDKLWSWNSSVIYFRSSKKETCAKWLWRHKALSENTYRVSEVQTVRNLYPVWILGTHSCRPQAQPKPSRK